MTLKQAILHNRRLFGRTIVPVSYSTCCRADLEC